MLRLGRRLRPRLAIGAAAAAGACCCAASATASTCAPTESLRPFRPSLALADATAVIDEALELRRRHGVLPLAVVVLDAGGGMVACQREDGCAVMRVDIASGKAFGALSMGMPTRQLRERLGGRPTFQTSLTGIGNRVGKGWVAVPGGVLVLDREGYVTGAVGVSGDTSDKDEMVAVLAIRAVGGAERRLAADPAEPPEGWDASSLSH